MADQQTTLTSFVLTKNKIEEAVVSYKQSKTYMKVVLPMAVLNIVYNRVDMDPTQFVAKDCAGLQFMSHKRKSNNAIIRQYHAYMQGALRALEKSYLRKFYFVLKDKTSQEILEYFVFKFKYNVDGDQGGDVVKKRENLFHSTKEMLELLKRLSETPKWNVDNLEICVDLDYYDKVTPYNFCPGINFEAIVGLSLEEEIAQLTKKKPPFAGVLINTGFHRLNNYFGGRMLESVEESSINESIVVNTPDEENIAPDTSVAASCGVHIEEIITEVITLSDSESEDYETPSLTERTHKNDNNEPLFDVNYQIDKHKLSSLKKTVVQSPVSETFSVLTLSSDVPSGPAQPDHSLPTVTSCPCKMQTKHSQLEVVECTVCHKHYHTACQGYLRKSHLPPQFICIECGAKEGLECSDHVKFVDTERRSIFSKMRLVIAYCYNTGSPAVDVLKEMDRETHRIIMNKLSQFNIMLMDSNGRVIVEKEKIEQMKVFTKFCPEHDSMKLSEVTDSIVDAGSDEPLKKKRKL